MARFVDIFALRDQDIIFAGLKHLGEALLKCPQLTEINFSDNVLNAKSVVGIQNLL